MEFCLFSNKRFEVAYPLSLIECYCFQSDFYVNYDLPQPRRTELVNKIGARIKKSLLPRCTKIVESASVRNTPIFAYNVPSGIDKLLGLGDKGIRSLVEELSDDVISKLVMPGIGLSKATKILHTVYPHVIPMIDNLLQGEYLRQRRESNPSWSESDASDILFDYYKNLQMESNWRNLTTVYEKVSGRLPGLTKVRVFDIIWWSYLKAERISENNHIHWSTIK